MGIIDDYLRKIIIKQIDEYGIVVWYDPEKWYEKLPDPKIPNTNFVRFPGSWFGLRKTVETMLEQQERPRLLVYIPQDPGGNHHALAETEAYGVILKPGQQPPTRNTKLSVIVRGALKATGQWTDQEADAISKQIDAGKYASLDEVEQVIRLRGEATGVLQLIFGSPHPQEIALRFLSDPGTDDTIQSKQALPELCRLFKAQFEIEFLSERPPEETRGALTRSILVAELAYTMEGLLPAELIHVPLPRNPGPVETTVGCARAWRLRRNLMDSYCAAANQVEKDLQLAKLDLPVRPQMETFQFQEKRLQAFIEEELLTSISEEQVKLARSRQSSFWSEAVPELQAHWALIASAGQVLLEAGTVERELKGLRDPSKILERYTGPDNPWCLLDSSHRYLERRYHNFEFDLGARHERLERLALKARSRFMETGSSMAEAFLRSHQAHQFSGIPLRKQSEIYEKAVKPALKEGRVAYVLVDALRYEMGHELARSLGGDFAVELTPALASIPTITEIGMPSLLPGASAAEVVAGAEGKLALKIGDTVLKTREDRINFLKKNAGVEVFDVKLENLIPKPRKKIQDALKSAQLILVTSQEIDALCEGDNIPLARRTMDEVLLLLRRAFRILQDSGIAKIIVSADHGYLFGEELESDMKIDPPGGKTIDLHRRVWVGHGGTADPSYLRVKLADLGIKSEFEIAVPWGFACFKARGGAKAYFHGGMAPQELVIPLMILTPTKRAAAPGAVKWTITLGSRIGKIGRFCSVVVTGKSEELFEWHPPKIRVEVRDRTEVISKPVSASHGFDEATGEIQMRSAAQDNSTEPNTITLMIDREPAQKNVDIVLSDASTGMDLARIKNVELAIGI